MLKKKLPMMGWFSFKQSELTGTNFYTRLNGGEVEITCITKDGDHGCGWDDMVFVGEVLDWVRCGLPRQIYKQPVPRLWG